MFATLFITTFGILLCIVIDKTPGEDSTYVDTGRFFRFFLMAFRTSIGDFEMGSFLDTTEGQIIAWFIWIVIMIVGNMIFMNFIIAVVN